ncbi:MAG: SLC26A/SulP transporter family protein [Legionellaceae bacterium]|nr:SLC26A/SulP transporter family protein [Legionellaceae bacterium]
MNKAKNFCLTLLAAVFISALVSAYCLSLASLIYSGPMHQHLLFGISGSLLGAGIMLVTLACFSSSTVTIAGPQEIFALIAALVTTSLVQTFERQGIDVDPLPTVLCVIAIIAMLSGLSMYLIGSMNLGKLVRFIPFPVIGGFLAGTGWLIMISTIASLTNSRSALETLQQMMTGADYTAWLIPLGFGVAILIANQRIKNSLTFPAMLLLGFFSFYAYLAAAGIPLRQAINTGWMLGPFASGTLPVIPNLAMVNWVQWTLLGQYAGHYFEATVLGVISLFLNISGFEIGSKQTMNIDTELKCTGIANILAPLLGGHSGYQYVSLSKTNLNFNLDSRWVGILSGLFCFALLFVGTEILSYLPAFLFSGMLIYIGLDFMLEWLWNIRKQISLLDYLIILSITLIIVVWSLLAGILIGLLLSLAIFAFHYSRVPVVSSILTGRILQSNVERNEADHDLLEQFGERILIINVHGYLFFGNVYEMTHRIIHRLETQWPATEGTHPDAQGPSGAGCYLILNFSEVSGLEITGIMSLMNLIRYTRYRHINTIFASLPVNIAQKIDLLTKHEQQTLADKRFPDIDHALAWCENEVLQYHRLSEPTQMEQLFHLTFPGIDNSAALLDFAEKVDFAEGEVMCHEGDQSKDLFWLAEGELDAVIAHGEADHRRLKRILPGSIIGEMALYLNQPRSATIIAVTPCLAYRFTPQAIEKLTHAQPERAAIFHKSVVTVLAKRLQYANRLLWHVS